MSEPRMPPLDLEDAVTASEVGVPRYLAQVNLYRVLLRHPPLAKSISDLVVRLWRRSTLDARLRELVIMRVAWLTDCSYEWAHHWAMAQGAGITEEELGALRRWEGATCFGARDRAVLSAVDQIITHASVGDETWSDLVDHLGAEDLLLELLATISTWRSVAELLNTLRVPLEDGFATWLPDGVGPKR